MDDLAAARSRRAEPGTEGPGAVPSAEFPDTVPDLRARRALRSCAAACAAHEDTLAALASAVRFAADEGCSWQEIATATGLSVPRARSLRTIAPGR